MPDNEPSPPLPKRHATLEETIGLCAKCSQARRIVSSRGFDFWLCQRSATDPAYARYPRLPVTACVGFEPGAPTNS